jgi:hypothetical protein
MTPDLSEFSYGYALTEELATGPLGPLKAAPVFPSLLQEGKSGGGYDVKLPFAGVPLFLQFKVAHWMERSSALEWARMKGPYYRMHLRSVRHSRQHDLLRNLEKGGQLVYYAAPEFHESEVLNDAYLKRQVVARSAFFRPGDIGALDDEHHYVVYRADSNIAWVCSHDPREIPRMAGTTWPEHVWAEMRARRPMDAAQLGEVLAEVLGVTPHDHDALLTSFARKFANDRESALAAAAGHLSRTYLGCQLIFLEPIRGQ